MSLHADLIEQADHLARKEPRRPRQASLRRSVSASYYGVFHLLTEEATRMFLRGEALARLRPLLARSFSHGQMKAVSTEFGKGAVPKGMGAFLGTVGVPDTLSQVATAFVDLQQARHEADYDLSRRFSRNEALAFIAQAKRTVEQWPDVRAHPAAQLFLLALLAKAR